MVDARLLELNKVCRTCLKDVESEEELISIFLSIQDLSISRSQISYCEMLKIILPSNLISDDDTHPKNVCFSCVQQIRVLFVFRMNAAKSHEILTRKIEEQAAKFDEINNFDEFLADITRRNVSEQADPTLGETLSNSHIFQDTENTLNETASNVGKEKEQMEKSFRRNVSKVSGFEHLVWKSDKLDDGLRVSVNKNINILGIHTCETCQRIFCTRESYLTHDFDCVRNCEECGINFTDPLALQNHISEHQSHGEDDQSRTYTKAEFVSKFIKGLDKLKISCLACKRKIDKKSLNTHIQGSHAQVKNYKCSFCSESFYDPPRRSMHMKKKHSDKYRCSEGVCKAQFSKHASIVRHGKSAHNVHLKVKKSTLESIDPEIDIVKFVKVRNEILNPNPVEVRKQFAKKKTHTREEVQIREKSATPPVSSIELTFAELKEKYFEVRGFDTFCKICKCIFLAGSASIHAKNKHANSFPYLCALCDRGFYFANHRTAHMRRKHPKELYCHPCNQEFIKPAPFAEHMRKSHAKIVKVTDKEIDVPLSKLKFSLKALENSDENDSDCEIVSVVHPVAPVIKKEELIIKDEIIKEEVLADDSENYDEFDDNETNEDETEYSDTFNNDGLDNQHVAADGEKQDDEVEVEVSNITYEIFKSKFITTLNDDNFRCELCSLRLVGFKNLILHMCEDHAATNFTFCELCDEGFNSENKRLDHMEEKHSGKYECPLCSCQFTKGSAFQDHMKEDHDQTLELAKRNFKEDLPIEKIFFHASSSWQINASQNGQTSTAIENETRQDNNLSLTDHNDNLNVVDDQKQSDENLSKDIDCDVFLCDVCDFVAPRRDLMDNHLKKNHPQEFKCGQCSFISGSYILLKQHIIRRHPDKVAYEFSRCHKCPRCCRSFNKMHSLKDHIKYWHGAQEAIPNNCEACNMTMKNDRTFKKHCENRFHKDHDRLLNEEKAKFEAEKQKALKMGKPHENENLVDEIEQMRSEVAEDTITEHVSDTNNQSTSDDEDESESAQSHSNNVSLRSTRSTRSTTAEPESRPSINDTLPPPSRTKRSRISELTSRIDTFFRPLKKSKIEESESTGPK